MLCYCSVNVQSPGAHGYTAMDRKNLRTFMATAGLSAFLIPLVFMLFADGRAEGFAETGARDTGTVFLEADDLAEPDEEISDIFHDQNLAVWSDDSNGDIELVFSAGSAVFSEASVEVEVTFIARLGPYSHTWSQGPYTIARGAELAVEPTLPSPDEIHGLAAEQGIDLYGHATVGAHSGSLPAIAVTWPLGPSADAALLPSVPGDAADFSHYMDDEDVQSLQAQIDAGNRVLPPMGISHRGRGDTGGGAYHFNGVPRIGEH